MGKANDVFGPFFSSGQRAYPQCQPETMITPTKIRHLAVTTDKFNGQPNDPEKRPAIPGKEYL